MSRALTCHFLFAQGLKLAGVRFLFLLGMSGPPYLKGRGIVGRAVRALSGLPEVFCRNDAHLRKGQEGLP